MYVCYLHVICIIGFINRLHIDVIKMFSETFLTYITYEFDLIIKSYCFTMKKKKKKRKMKSRLPETCVKLSIFLSFYS